MSFVLKTSFTEEDIQNAEIQSNLKNHACEALVLAYSPEEQISNDGENIFYIPSWQLIEADFGCALRHIFGTEKSGHSISDRVKWQTINQDEIEIRIIEGTQNTIQSDKDYASFFESYVSTISYTFDNYWKFNIGYSFRFKDGIRDGLLERFHSFWNKSEKKQWTNIHRSMRQYRNMKERYQ